MQSISASVTRALPVGAKVDTCDNSGAKMIQIISVKGHKTVKRRLSEAGVGDMVTASVIKGKPEMRHQIVLAVIVRQKQEYKRPDGKTIKFADNAAIVLKDEKGNPKGTIFKGAIAKEVAERWPAVAKVAKIMV
ncbi:MAG: 50S ribosomal protein L14 [Nanoarchaeota archaeon]|nr:50S ribosomal protein L14 [Nanoarchaeota archaeon]MBU4241880.1 50S ribosomal protein L14 [Nanoarchaeota archaeon]MBU4352468.1 50S ribosomal protein L14 [Nanoarchaeota archaeon]MBU4456003.1 50S ribosomal protein L14 [Nanoarchaeota archaeon]MCG2719422.1 50S ribosomal protein L14 [Nanoarchaeota archaeon]